MAETIEFDGIYMAAMIKHQQELLGVPRRELKPFLDKVLLELGIDGETFDLYVEANREMLAETARRLAG